MKKLKTKKFKYPLRNSATPLIDLLASLPEETVIRKTPKGWVIWNFQNQVERIYRYEFRTLLDAFYATLNS